MTSTPLDALLAREPAAPARRRPAAPDPLDVPASAARAKKPKRDLTGDFAAQAAATYERKIALLGKDVDTAADYARYAADAALPAEMRDGYVPDEKLAVLQRQMQKGLALARAFHRPRKAKPVGVDYVNKKNARFNRGVSRAYDAYTEEIRDALERS